MYLFAVLMFTSMGIPNYVQLLLRQGERPDMASMWVGAILGYGLLIVFAVLAHRDYKVARAALAADPALRGRWLTENSWWIAFVGPVVVGLVALFGFGAFM